MLFFSLWLVYCPVSILHKSISGRYRPVRVPDGPITARYRFIKNASLVSILVCITKTCLYNFDPLKHHFYTGLQGCKLYFLFLLKNIDCGYSLEPPGRGGSNEYPQSMFLSRNMKSEFLSENLQFLEVKFSIYLNRRVFEMVCSSSWYHL